MRFSKYHGTGNDFVLFEDLTHGLELGEQLVADVCDRHRGVGAAGVIRIAPSERAAFFMDYRNADGQLAEMCGNGIRCLAKYVYDRGLTAKTELDVDTRAGVKHLVLVGANLARLDHPRVGPPLEHHADFPERTNVEFIDVDDGVVNVRVWERGSGETMACGTGACASLVAANLMGLAPRRAIVRFPGGDIDVEWTEGTVLMTGPAEHVFDGTLADAWVAARMETAQP
ncbi:MAG TPA: diaminopimelate epimerase [Actinomycetota bacterium]|nr:diaminopimelate epimerase [Actinomycetota bacterium]